MLIRTASSKMSYRTMQRIYVFQLPTRIFHWINAFSILVLVITGYLIGDPPAIQHSTEAYTLNWFGINRYLHFATAWVFTIIWIMRVIWAFIGGNRWETWRNFIPTTKQKWIEVKDILIQDIFLMKNKHHVVIGHNALLGFFYFILFIVVIVTVITGFGLYIGISDSWVVALLGSPSRLFGNEMSIRFIHHISRWLIILFAIIHIYLILFYDIVEGRGETSSIISGWKFIEEKVWKKYKGKNE